MQEKNKRVRRLLCILLAVTILLGACALTLTAVLAFRAFGTDGLLTRSETVVKTAHFSVNSGMMGYFFTERINSYYEYYSQMLQVSDSAWEVEAAVYQAMGITDPALPFKEQDFSGKTESGETVTVFDFYMGLTEEHVTVLLTLCEYAYAEGVALTRDDLAEIARTVDQTEQTYKNEKKAAKEAHEPYPKTFGAYLQERYGAAMTEQDLRECLELVWLAEKAEQALTEEQDRSGAFEPDSSAVKKYVIDHYWTFGEADYYSYSFTVNNRSMSDAEFEIAKQDVLSQAKYLVNQTDMQDYERAVTELIVASDKQSYREKNWERYLRESNGDEQKAEEALQAYYDKTFTDAYMQTKFQVTHVTGCRPWSDNDIWGFGSSSVLGGEISGSIQWDNAHIKAMKDWLFGTEALGYENHASVGDMMYTEAVSTRTESDTSGEQTVTYYTVTVYRCAREPYLQTEITKRFGYAIFFNKADAERFYAELSVGEINMDTLYALAEQMHDQTSLCAYGAADDFLLEDASDSWKLQSGEDALLGDIKGIFPWLQHAAPGDCSGVLDMAFTAIYDYTLDNLTRKELPVYAVLVYDGEGREYWYTQARKGAVEQAGKDWYEQNRLELTFNRDAYELIDK